MNLSCLNDIKYSQHGYTPLIAASFIGHVEIVRILIEAKAQLNIQTKEVLCNNFHSVVLWLS